MSDCVQNLFLPFWDLLFFFTPCRNLSSMPHSPITNSFTSQRFRCPVETCQRACKTKAGWTKHLRLVHAHLDFSTLQSQDFIINLPHYGSSLLPTLNNSGGLASLPPSPVGSDYAHTRSDFEMEDIAHDNATIYDLPHRVVLKVATTMNTTLYLVVSFYSISIIYCPH